MSPHSIFGWSYPPGCSGVPDDEPDISPQSEEIFRILEDSGCDQKIIDKVVNIVDNLAYESLNCPECKKRRAEDEAKSFEQGDIKMNIYSVTIIATVGLKKGLIEVYYGLAPNVDLAGKLAKEKARKDDYGNPEITQISLLGKKAF